MIFVLSCKLRERGGTLSCLNVLELYHGSPHRLDELRPATATGKGDASAREHAIYLANNPEEARLYALTRPRNNKRKSWAILDNKVHYVKGDPINKQGYVYEHEFDDYEAPPESDPAIGYRVQRIQTHKA